MNSLAKVTPALVKELREMTGAGMMDCKKALEANDGDKQKAVDYLREKGIAKAAKKSNRIAAEGVVLSYVNDAATVGALVEINCETDFVSRGDVFHALVEKIAKHVAETNPKDLDELNKSQLDGKEVSVVIAEAIASIGEKISIRRFVRYELTEGRVASYIHMGGKIGVLVSLTGGTAELAKDVAMQIAAANPSCVDRSSVDPAALEHEREILRKQALEEGKPEKIVEKMVDGRINKYYKEVCLIEQAFVKDPEQTVGKILGKVKVNEFARFQMGEGIEKRQDDFAAEVMAQVK